MRMVWVCEHCRMASCWMGIFLCEPAIMRKAGVVQQSRAKCVRLAREHSDYFDRQEVQVLPGDPRERL